MTPRTALALLLAGIVGMVAYALAAALLVDSAQLSLLAKPAFYLVGIFFVLPAPVVYRFLPDARGAALALALMTLMPALASKLGGETMLAWHVLLALTFVYALTALVVYRLVAGAPKAARAPGGPPAED
ncbi:hypothetical protein [Pelagibius marinus]|uniref:hypothetical protein n=1 Tax=Pelagibius marinus TaxID=2762760 RepID=UPI0018730FDC|nr:hypothetical protein [Pelagibius marinus]